MFINYPNNPTGRDRPRRPVRARDRARARHTTSSSSTTTPTSETTFDGYVAPSFLATPGAKEVGVEVFSLSKGYNMTGWRCAAIVGNAEAIAQYWRLKSNIDSGLFEAVQLAGAAALAPEVDAEVARDERGLPAPARPRLRRAGPGRRAGHAAARARSTSGRRSPRGSPTAAEYCEHVLEQAAVVISPGGAYGPNGEGFFRISLTTPDDRLLEAVERLSRL